MFYKLWAHSRQQGREARGRATVGNIHSRSGDGVEDCLVSVVLSWMDVEGFYFMQQKYFFSASFIFLPNNNKQADENASSEKWEIRLFMHHWFGMLCMIFY